MHHRGVSDEHAAFEQRVLERFKEALAGAPDEYRCPDTGFYCTRDDWEKVIASIENDGIPTVEEMREMMKGWGLDPSRVGL